MNKKDEIKRIFEVVPGMINPDEGLFLYELAARCSKGVIVEIGSYLGLSTICTARGSKSGNKMPVYSIDPHNGGGTTPDPTWRDSSDPGTPGPEYYLNTGIAFPAFQERLKTCKVDDIVKPIVNYSELAYKQGWDKPIEMLFIDGEHRYNYVKMDLETWGKHVISGGTILLHDHSHFGVTKVINETVLNNPKYTNIDLFPTYHFTVKEGVSPAP